MFWGQTLTTVLRDLEFVLRDLEFILRDLDFDLRDLEFVLRDLEFHLQYLANPSVAYLSVCECSPLKFGCSSSYYQQGGKFTLKSALVR